MKKLQYYVIFYCNKHENAHSNFKFPVILSIFSSGAGPSEIQVVVPGEICVCPASVTSDHGKPSSMASCLICSSSFKLETLSTTFSCPFYHSENHPGLDFLTCSAPSTHA